MRTSSVEPRRLRPGLVVLCGALVGTLAGLGLPGALRTSAGLTSRSTVGASVSVPVCAHAWAAQVAALSPALHWSFDAAGSPSGDVPAPGLLRCDTSGALTLHGGVEEFVSSTGAALADGSTATAALKLLPDAAASSGDLLWLTQPGGHAIGVRLASGAVELVETPSGGGAAVTLGSSALPPAADGRSLLVTVTRTGGIIALWLDGSAVVIASLAEDPGTAAILTVGAPAGSGRPAAGAVVDEVLVLPVALTGTQVAALVAADSW